MKHSCSIIEVCVNTSVKALITFHARGAFCFSSEKGAGVKGSSWRSIKNDRLILIKRVVIAVTLPCRHISPWMSKQIIYIIYTWDQKAPESTCGMCVSVASYQSRENNNSHSTWFLIHKSSNKYFISLFSLFHSTIITTGMFEWPFCIWYPNRVNANICTCIIVTLSTMG